jgi:hypothetical protein
MSLDVWNLLVPEKVELVWDRVDGNLGNTSATESRAKVISAE